MPRALWGRRLRCFAQAVRARETLGHRPNALVRQVLEEWLGERQRPVAEGERAVFVGRGERRLAKRSVDDVVRGLGEDAGVKLSAHLPRHMFLTRMVRQGSDLVLVAELAGHRRLETTRRCKRRVARASDASCLESGRPIAHVAQDLGGRD